MDNIQLTSMFNQFNFDCCCDRKKTDTPEELRAKTETRRFILDKIAFSKKDLTFGNIIFRKRISIKGGAADQTDLFNTYDFNQDGQLSRDEMTVVTNDLCVCLFDAMRMAKKDATSTMSVGEAAKLDDIMSLMSNLDNLKDVFSKISDTDQDGKISGAEFIARVPIFVENYLDSMFNKMDLLHQKSLRGLSVGYSEDDGPSKGGSDDGKNSGNIAVEVPQEMETKGGT